MFNNLINSVRYLLSFVNIKPKTYGLSTDNKVMLKELPEGYPTKDMTFSRLNRDLGIFEVVKVDKVKREITLAEVATDHEIVVSINVYNYLFTKYYEKNRL